MNLDLPYISGKNVLIIGYPATGKTYVSRLIDKNSHSIIHTDDYKNSYSFNEYPTSLIKRINSETRNTLVEGILGYIMLLEGARRRTYYPDIVIEIKSNLQCVEKTYMREREYHKFFFLNNFNVELENILQSYKRENKKNFPQWEVIYNIY